MALGWTLIIILAVVVVIWVTHELKTFKHKFFAIFIILLILFAYLSFAMVFKGKDIDLKSAEGVQNAGKLYFSWLGSVFTNLKSITANAINMDWNSMDNSTKDIGPENSSKPK